MAAPMFMESRVPKSMIFPVVTAVIFARGGLCFAARSAAASLFSMTTQPQPVTVHVDE